MRLPLAIQLDAICLHQASLSCAFSRRRQCSLLPLEDIDIEPRASKEQHRGVTTPYQDASPRETKILRIVVVEFVHRRNLRHLGCCKPLE